MVGFDSTDHPDQVLDVLERVGVTDEDLIDPRNPHDVLHILGVKVLVFPRRIIDPHQTLLFS